MIHDLESELIPVRMVVNGVAYELRIPPDRNLLSAIRLDLGLTGPKEGCDDCECGACIVLMDGGPVNSCSYLAAQADGRDIQTVEGLAEAGQLHPLQEAILEHGGVQCGFCTPGMLMSAKALLDADPDPDVEAVKIALSGNLCRCTGYARILAAVQDTAVTLRAQR